MTQTVAFDLRFPATQSRTTASVCAVLLGSLALVAAAHIKIPLAISPVPLTLQTLVVALIAATLGSRRAGLVAAVYAVSSFVIPGLSATGSWILTGGYILGFVPAAVLTGFLFSQGYGRTLLGACFAMGLCSALILASGFLWLSVFQGTGMAFQTGVLPFVPVEVLKVGAAALVLRGLSSWIDRLAADRR